MDGQAGRRRPPRRDKFYQGLIAELYAHAEALFDRAHKQGVGGSYAQHIAMLEAEGVELPPELRLPDCPPAFDHIMTWFDELSAQRRKVAPIVFPPTGPGKPQRVVPQTHPLVWADMLAWSQLTSQRPRPDEWGLLQQLEVRFINAANRAASAANRG